MRKVVAGIGLLGCLSMVAGCHWFHPRYAVAKLCDEHGKYDVHRQLRADGVLIRNADRDYVGFGALVLFERTGLKYIEVPSAERELPHGRVAYDVVSGHADYLLSRKYVRVYLAAAGSGDCIKWKEGPLSSGGWGEGQLASSNQCIAAIPVDAFMARHVATSETIESPMKSISSVRFSIQDSASGEVIAEAVNFYHTGGSGKFRATASCWGYGSKFLNHDFSIFALMVRAFPRHGV